MRHIFILYLLFSFIYSVVAKNEIPKSYFNNSHDISSLPLWGPYSKKYAGISHIADINKGIRFDFSVMPGYYRNKQFIPHVLFESGYYPWLITPDLDKVTYRYELEWKDKVFCDVTYHLVSDSSVFVQIDCNNNTSVNQNLMINLFSYIDYENNRPMYKFIGNKNLQWYKAIDYKENEPIRKTPQYGLIYDGKRRNEEYSACSISGFVIGSGFAKDKGDKISYTIDIYEGQENGIIAFRHNTPIGKEVTFNVSGISDTIVCFKGEGKYVLSKIKYKNKKAGKYEIKLTSEGESSTVFDGFFIGKDEHINSIKIMPNIISRTPKLIEDSLSIIAKYEILPGYYGLAWDDNSSIVREVLNSDLDSYFRKKTHDHVSKLFKGDHKSHYNNIFIRPVVLEPQSKKTITSYICYGDINYVQNEIKKFHNKKYSNLLEEDLNDNTNKILNEGRKYEFGQQLLQAAMLSNIVYPIYTQGEYIRHFTPGKNWNSLYTWDSGFIANGLIDIDIIKAFECIKAYTTEIDSESAFVHHGTPLPIQIYAFQDLWNACHSDQMLTFLYPRLKQFFDFMIGRKPYSTTNEKKTGLLSTWDYFYNSGGWDDYPPQHSLKGLSIDEKKIITPVVTTSYYIRAAKTLRLAASYLGLTNDIKEYDEFINKTSDSLLRYSWDDESKYFSYVVHDNSGNYVDIYRYKDGTNYNKGLDGTSPLIANICPDEINEYLINHIFSSDEMWSPIGISTVDKSASYYSNDGYWNGTVWFPHQYLIWKSLLDIGEGDKAFKIAQTALETWQKECNESYYTFEHFIISSQRGAGWHQFSGLSSPILNWFSSYYKIGKVATGFEVWMEKSNFNSDYSGFNAVLNIDYASNPHSRIMLVCMNPKFSYNVTVDGKSVDVKKRYPGLMEIYLPAENKKFSLSIIKK